MKKVYCKNCRYFETCFLEYGNAEFCNAKQNIKIAPLDYSGRIHKFNGKKQHQINKKK